jgi:hypothetical protein
MGEKYRRINDYSPIRLLIPLDVARLQTCGGPPPDDIHSRQGVGGDAYEFVFFGRNPALERHHYYDPDVGTVSTRFATEPKPD